MKDPAVATSTQTPHCTFRTSIRPLLPRLLPDHVVAVFEDIRAHALRRALGRALVVGLSAFSLFACVGASAAADAGKTLYFYFEAPETGFDPAQFADHYSLEVVNSIFEPLLKYDYLARPQKLVPDTTTGLPEIGEGGRTFVFKIKPGIYFADDPASSSPMHRGS